MDNHFLKGRQGMQISIVRTLASLALALNILAEPVAAQGTAPHPPSEPTFGALPGRWVRPDGGYVITIKSVDAGGKLDAAYANPNPLPFSRAEAVRDGKTIRLFFELRAGGYNGSTYTLSYDPANDLLKGVYYQAVVQQKFDVHFTRVRQ
ncbi:hypothetical protein [Accumulibacter sp.]|uniref:hypothetical protein n=1 Tax=Accumulibacter sp. TaxID=2053492 RepID=UPI00258B87BA|nr:hypothetical protein [Accumulibacter sp.]